MNEFDCPACGQPIPDDSLYCDMCGVELLQCLDCGTIGCDVFCPECGHPMVSRLTALNLDTTASAKQPHTHTTTQNTQTTSPTPVDNSKTVGGRGRGATLALVARKGRGRIVPADNTVIGREGAYADVLADMGLVSRNHARFIRRGRDWYIDDLDSTNGTLINDIELVPGQPRKITVGDVVDLGTYIFDVVSL